MKWTRYDKTVLDYLIRHLIFSKQNQDTLLGKLPGEFIQIIQVDICLSVYYLHDNFIRIAFVMCTS